MIQECVKMQIHGPCLRDSYSVGLGWGPNICVMLGDYNARGS